jgi:hypothetical protein
MAVTGQLYFYFAGFLRVSGVARRIFEPMKV